MPKPKITYRFATIKDAAAMAALRYDFYAEDGEATTPKTKYINECKKFLSTGIKNKSWVHILAIHENKIIGNASIHKTAMIPRPNKSRKYIAYLTNMYVAPEFRNDGVGRTLIKKAKEYADKNNYESMIVWPSDRAKNLYERLGFDSSTELSEVRF